MKSKNRYIELPEAQRAFAIMRDLQEEARRLGYLLPRRDLNVYLFKQGLCAQILMRLMIINRDDAEAVHVTQIMINQMLSKAENFRKQTSHALEEIRQEEREITTNVEEIEQRLDQILKDVKHLDFNTTETSRQIDAAKEALNWDLNDALKAKHQDREDYRIPYGFLYEGLYLLLDEVREDYPMGTAFRLAARRAAFLETGEVIQEAHDAEVSYKTLAKLLGIPKAILKEMAKGEKNVGYC